MAILKQAVDQGLDPVVVLVGVADQEAVQMSASLTEAVREVLWRLQGATTPASTDLKVPVICLTFLKGPTRRITSNAQGTSDTPIFFVNPPHTSCSEV